MGQLQKPIKAILFCGLLYLRNMDFNVLCNDLEEIFGTIILKSHSFPFHETDYYRNEMGESLIRVWVAFDRLIDPDMIVDIKQHCNQIERDRFSSSGKRRVNIDPGYLTLGKVVLATTKNNQQRLYLGSGIYGEVTLRYIHKSYKPWEWTYSDYRRSEALNFFLQLRTILKRLLRERSAGS